MRTFLSLLLIPVRCAWGRSESDASVPRILAALAAASCLAIAPTSLAQQDEEDEGEPTVVEADDAEVEEVVVTGSRLKRDTYTSVAPLQIITGEVSREAGIIDATEIVQNATVSSGAQYDVTWTGFVLDDGPGTETANLRGLAASRTLVLVNSRRLGPAGVEGAPTSPDLGLVPGSLVQQYDLLLDGASSIYGSDAVAGVVNVILRKDFDGLEIEAFPRRFHHGAGEQNALSLTWGKNFDRGFVGVGSEYYDTARVTLADRPWTAGCRKHVEIDEGGRIRHKDLWYAANLGMEPPGDCALGSLVGRTFVPGTDFGSIYYTPGRSNGGWPNFSEANSPYGTFGADADGDGETDVNYFDYSTNGRHDHADFRGPSKTLNLMAFGEYTFEGEMNITPFFEVIHAEDEWSSRGDGYYFAPEVPARNPFNICNPEGAGVDCGLAYQEFLANPNYARQFADYYNPRGCFGAPPAFCTPQIILGFFGLWPGPMGPTETIPILNIRGDRNEVYRDLTQRRFVVGVGGDLPMLDFASLSGWTFELAYVQSRSDGTSRRPGIREDRMELALGTYSTGNVPCENDTDEELASDVAPGCVPVNFYAPSLYTSPDLLGDFATQAERDYLFDDRDFATEYIQTVITYYMTGTLFELPAGAVSAGFGLEYRTDEIKSIPDHVARDGLFWGFFADGGAEGEKFIREAFGEVELPLLADQFAATELTLNLSTRWTDDEYGGTAWTGSAKLAYRPINSLLFRATGGTSFRAPNLRELFLKDQTGFLSVFDPCLLPDAAIDPLTNEYDPAEDDREPHVLENCRATGIDPLSAHNGGRNFYGVEVAAGGSLDLGEETSESITAGFAWEQPFTNAFDLTIGANYYQIEIDNTIIEPSTQYVINQCYYSETGLSPFCSRITRGEVFDGRGPFIEYVFRGFANRDNETVRGTDFNVAFNTTFTAFDRPFALGVDINAHRLIERSTLEVSDDGVPDFQEYQREWYYPEYRGSANVRLDYDRWRLSWTARYVSPNLEWDGAVDPFGDISASTGFGADTCLGPPDDLLCRDYADAPSYTVHSASLGYRGDSWSVRIGSGNLFDKKPPAIQEYAATLKNVPLGAAYDLQGRTYFLSIAVRMFEGG